MRRAAHRDPTIDSGAVVSFVVPLKLGLALNSREHWRTKAKRTKSERGKVARAIAKAGARCPGPLLVVQLTRVAPRQLDDDNVRGALKACRDQVAAWLGIDDRSRLVRWEYEQEKGEPAVRVAVKVLPSSRQNGADGPAERQAEPGEYAHLALQFGFDAAEQATGAPRGPTLAKLEETLGARIVPATYRPKKPRPPSD